MTLITTKQDGRPLYRVRWNYRTDDGREAFDERKFRSKTEARAFEKRITAATTSSTERISVSELVDAWLELHVTSRSLRTQKDYRAQVELRIKPFLGAKRCARLTPATIAEWQRWMLAQERVVHSRSRDEQGRLVRERAIVTTGPAVANKSLAVLRAMLRWGRSVGMTETRAADDARPLPQQAPAPARPYSPSEVDRIAAGCELLRDSTLVYVAAYSGLRWSELCALEWSDIDFDAETIDLRRSLDIDRTTKSTKSGRERIVPILSFGVRALREWRAHAPAGIDLVFPDEAGGPLSSNWYRHDRTTNEVTADDRNLGRIRKACGIHFEMHQLRDTYASILIQSGIGDAELTLWLGHRSTQTTIRRYGKLFEKRKAALASKANELLATL